MFFLVDIFQSFLIKIILVQDYSRKLRRMEAHEHYEIQFWHDGKEIFVWATGIVPIIPKENESIFLATDLPRRGMGSWWTVKEVVYQYHISENTADLKQRILINLDPLKHKMKGVFKA